MQNLKSVILNLPEFRGYFDPNEPLDLLKCASYLGQRLIQNALINSQIDDGIASYKYLMETRDDE
jgi:hypothetical protein